LLYRPSSTVLLRASANHFLCSLTTCIINCVCSSVFERSLLCCCMSATPLSAVSFVTIRLLAISSAAIYVTLVLHVARSTLKNHDGYQECQKLANILCHKFAQLQRLNVRLIHNSKVFSFSHPSLCSEATVAFFSANVTPPSKNANAGSSSLRYHRWFINFVKAPLASDLRRLISLFGTAFGRQERNYDFT
jgi:hypothetical protein